MLSDNDGKSAYGNCGFVRRDGRIQATVINGVAGITDMTDEISMEDKQAGLYDALRAVIDPEIGMNIIELGLVRGAEIGEDSAHVNMIMTTPFCPYAPQLLEQTRRTAQDFLGLPTTIEMGMEMWDPSMMEEGAASDWGLF